MPSCTQILYAIGVGDKVGAAIIYEDYPYNFSASVAAGNMTYDGGYGTPDMEAIALLHPDLIISDNINDASLPSMRALGYKVIVSTHPTSPALPRHIARRQGNRRRNSAIVLIENITNSINAVAAKIAAANITVPDTVYYGFGQVLL